MDSSFGHLESERGLYQHYKRVHLSPLILEKNKYLYIFQELLKQLHNSSILNIGCGRDVLFSDLQEKGAEIIELDIVIEPLKEIKARGAHHVIRADARHLPFTNDRFDLVFAIGVLHHLNSVEKALSEAIRVTRNGKFVLFSEPNRVFLPTELIELLPKSLKYYLRRGIFPKLFHLYTPPASYERTFYPKEIRRIIESKVNKYFEIFEVSPHIAIHSLPAWSLKLWMSFIGFLEKIKFLKIFCPFLSYKFIIICKK